MFSVFLYQCHCDVFFVFFCRTVKILMLVCVQSLLRWNPVSQRQCPAGGEELQWPSLHCVPLADRLVGAVHRGLVHSGQQHICGSNTWRRCLLLSGDANPQGHLCPGQCGPGSSKKVRHYGYKHCKRGLFNWYQMNNILIVMRPWCGTDSGPQTTRMCMIILYVNGIFIGSLFWQHFKMI